MRNQFALFFWTSLTPLTSLTAQATNPPYLAQFPSVAKVKQAMQVADPRETALRQMGALWQLKEIIKQLSGSREFRGFLPDEARLIGVYDTAAYSIGKAIDAAYPGTYQQARTVSQNTPYMYMRTDPRFGSEGIQTFQALLTPQIAELFDQSVGVDQARHLARLKADSEAMMRAREQAGAPTQPTKLEQEQAGIRRCVESGRSETECMVEGLGKSFKGMLGEAMPGLSGMLDGPKLSGVRMSGEYPGPGKFHLSFYPTEVTVSCADLVPQSVTYSVAVQNGVALITIRTLPRPVTLTVRPDDRLAGPAAADITGQVQVGVQYGTRTWSDGRTEPISRPVYDTFTRHCNIGVLTTSGSSAPNTVAATTSTLIGAVFGSVDKNTPPPAPPGLRMAGEYGSQGALDIEFRPEGAVVGCRDVAVLRPYSVHVRANQVSVDVENGTAPFSLVLGPDGRLTGAGNVRVDGRAVTGTDGNGGITYAPRSASCGVGTIAVAGGASAPPSPTTPTSPTSPTTPTSPTQPTGALGPAAAALGTPSPGSGAFFQVEGGIAGPAGSPNPFTGRSILLLDVGLDNVLKEAGMTIPPGGSAAKVLAGCNPAQPTCQKLLQTLVSHAVAFLRPDQSGIAQSPELQAGRFYTLLASAQAGGKLYLWARPVMANQGWNKVTLDQRNALP
jgi:hypothetical protein